MGTDNRLVAVSNRLPIVLRRDAGDWRVEPGSGGLITALAPVLQDRGGLWIGWPGTEETEGLEHALDSASAQAGYDFKPVLLTEDEIEGHYYGFANEILWPLFHGFETRCNFDPAYWHHYRSSNRKFAAAIAEHSREGDFVWIHDYHLMLVARELKELRPQQRTAFFLHTPFPPPDIFFKLPWRAHILEGLLAADLVGFQTMRDRRNFTQCLQETRLSNLRLSGRGAVVKVEFRDREIRVGAFPISVDYEAISARASSKDIADGAWLFHEHFPNRRIMIGMDRLDYTKGIPERLEAFRTALRRYPYLNGKLSMVQVTVPSRGKVAEYENLRHEIERLVGDINGELTQPGDWIPVHYIHRSLARDEVYAYLRASEIALVTPLRDGMNLVAKEYCACNVDETGVLILSEFAGAAAELRNGALLVNPYDVEGMASAIHQALHMDIEERKKRMRKLREQVKRNDVFKWVDAVLEAAAARKLSDFPRGEELIPQTALGSEKGPHSFSFDPAPGGFEDGGR
jgi:trehalose 6-phosphate synthase